MKDIKAYELFSKSDFGAVIPLLEDHILVNSQDVKAIYHLSLAYRRLNDHIKSLELMERACRLMPNDVDLLSELGVGKFHLNDKNGALEDMNSCVELEPNNPYRYSSRAYIKANLHDLDGAIKDYEKAIELDPEDVIALNNLGLLEEKLGNIEKAKNKFRATDSLLGEKDSRARPEDIQKLLDESRPITQEEFEAQNGKITETSKSKKLTFQSYFDTLKFVLGSKEGRKEFLSFLSGRSNPQK